MADQFTRNSSLEGLHPIFRAAAQAVLQRLSAESIPFRIFESFRSPQRQSFLFSQGRTRPGSIVTKARPWQSYHQYGLAADFVLFENNTWSWDTSGSKQAWWGRLLAIGRESGLESLSFEMPHLQVAGLTIQDLLSGRFPKDGDTSWADSLEAAIVSWNGVPPAPPAPTITARPALPPGTIVDGGAAPAVPSFSPDDLIRTVITEPLFTKISNNDDLDRMVIIDINQDYRDGREAAVSRIQQLTSIVLAKAGLAASPERSPTKVGSATATFLKATLSGRVIRDLVNEDEAGGQGPEKNRNAIYRIWEDFEVHALITKSISTVKADAAQIAFLANGRGIVWAVLDSGVDATHVHFAEGKNLELALPLAHKDYTGTGNPLHDELGHGTHVAGILAGGVTIPSPDMVAVRKTRNPQGQIVEERQPVPRICGMAPACSLVSMKILNARGVGQMSNILAALDDIQKINDYGRRLLIHGVNLSAGYDFDPEWFACGQSPLCIEINRLVRSGVVVVVAAGNTGYGLDQSNDGGLVAAGQSLTINDPGNADLAITVGSTHREMPHIYGVSYFSSKGPTGDGRCKPDLVAPGERILSCAAGQRSIVNAAGLPVGYVEDSGTSMAAPHVSGVIAAFLSIRSEFIGQPQEVKRLFLASATDLGRDRSFQGTGLVDLMRTIQNV